MKRCALSRSRSSFASECSVENFWLCSGEKSFPENPTDCCASIRWVIWSGKPICVQYRPHTIKSGTSGQYLSISALYWAKSVSTALRIFRNSRLSTSADNFVLADTRRSCASTNCVTSGTRVLFVSKFPVT